MNRKTFIKLFGSIFCLPFFKWSDQKLSKNDSYLEGENPNDLKFGGDEPYSFWTEDELPNSSVPPARGGEIFFNNDDDIWMVRRGGKWAKVEDGDWITTNIKVN